MPVQTRDQLKQWFETGDYPTQQQFWDWIDSFFHVNDGIAIANVTGLTAALTAKAEQAALDGFEQGELISYDADAVYVIPAGYLLEKILCKYGSAGTLKLSLVANGNEDVLPETDIANGWNRPIELNLVAEANTNLYLAGIPNTTKVLFIKRKIKMT
jgi:hypothetical protein